MSTPDNEAVAGRAATTHSWPRYGDRDAISNGVFALLDVNPFVGEGGTYDSVRPTCPDEAVATLIGAAQHTRRENMPGRGDPLRAANIGTGTGKMGELLARGGFLVNAIEPPKVMHTQASSIEGVAWHGGVAEDIGLPNGVYDIVVLARFWHRMDPGRADLEAARVLAPDGALAIMWNQMAVSIPWVYRPTRIMRSDDVHRLDRLPMPDGGFAPITLTQVAWEDRITPEEILTLGATRSSYIRPSEAGRTRMQKSLRWYLCEHLGYAPGELVTILYTTLVWLIHLREVGEPSARDISEWVPGTYPRSPQA